MKIINKQTRLFLVLTENLWNMKLGIPTREMLSGFPREIQFHPKPAKLNRTSNLTPRNKVELCMKQYQKTIETKQNRKG